MRTNWRSEVLITASNVSSVHEWLVANLYMIVILLGFSNHDRRLWECVATHVCSMDTPYVANSM
jgi:hypothetical protein